jgi:hypothetical protein
MDTELIEYMRNQKSSLENALDKRRIELLNELYRKYGETSVAAMTEIFQTAEEFGVECQTSRFLLACELVKKV